LTDLTVFVCGEDVKDNHSQKKKIRTRYQPTAKSGASNKRLRKQSFAKGYFIGNSDFRKAQLAFHKESPT
jgi:hypothetical protein